MAVLVDELIEYPHAPFGQRYWCHMMTDNLSDAGLEELHAMAEAIGMRREWFQDKPGYPHYDLTPERRARALQLGAHPVSGTELVTRCRRR